MTTHAAIRGPGGLQTAGLTQVSTPLAPERFRRGAGPLSCLLALEHTISRGPELLEAARCGR